MWRDVACEGGHSRQCSWRTLFLYLACVVRGEGGRIRYRRCRFRLDVHWSGFFFLQGRSLERCKHILVADLYDCLLLVTVFFDFFFVCFSYQDETVATVKE